MMDRTEILLEQRHFKRTGSRQEVSAGDAKILSSDDFRVERNSCFPWFRPSFVRSTS